MDSISFAQLQKQLTRMAAKKIAVVGDLMLDRYLWGSVIRISPEAPVPVVEVESESERLGGAANVANNIQSLGAVAIPIGVIGDDHTGRRLLNLAHHSGFPTEGIMIDANRPTTVKTRVIAHSQHVVRVDRESKFEITSATTQKIIEFMESLFPELDAILIEDYNKGLLTRNLIAEIIRFGRQHNVVIAVDPKFNHFFEYKEVTVFKPNRKEAEQALGIKLTDGKTAKDAAIHIKEKLHCQNVLVTLGEQGMLLLAENNQQYTIPTQSQKVHDVSGAGDTVISTLTTGLAAGANILEAALLANYAAGVVVGEIGAVPITIEKLQKAIETDAKTKKNE